MALWQGPLPTEGSLDQGAPRDLDLSADGLYGAQEGAQEGSQSV